MPRSKAGQCELAHTAVASPRVRWLVGKWANSIGGDPMQRSSVKLANRASRKIAEQPSLSHSGFAAHAAMALIVIVLLVLCLSSTVLAHDIYSNLRDRDGHLCCNGQDCKPVEATVLPNGNYYLPRTGETIPADMATPSPDDRFHHCISIMPSQMSLTLAMGEDPRLDASLLQCTLPRAGTPFNKFLNESYSYCGCNEPSGNQQPFGFAAVQYRNNDPHHAYPDGDQQRTIDARDDLSHQSPPVLTSSDTTQEMGRK